MKSLADQSNSDKAQSSSATSNPNPTYPLSLEVRFRTVRSVGEACIEEDELLNLLANKAEPIFYVRFEPSGRLHFAQVVMMAMNVKKLLSAGFKVKIWISDWCAMLNHEMREDLKKFEVEGHCYIEVLKALLVDVEAEKVEFIWASKETIARAGEYLPLVLDIALKNTVDKLTSHPNYRSGQIMGPSERDELTAAHILYPCLQCADILFLQADICQLGTDHQKVNDIAREYCDVIKRKNKPIILSHHMLPGLQQGQEKVSKSDPSSSMNFIFMDEEEADVNRKIKKAYCPPKTVVGNPCLEYIKYLIMPELNEFSVERSAENGGNKAYKSSEELIADYESGELHPADLKPALAKSLNRIREPVREHFKKNSNAKDIVKRVKAVHLARNRCTNTSNTVASLSISSSSSDLSNLNPTNQLSLEERFQMVRSVGEECIQEDELLNLLAKKPEPICYDGFEPSGRMHIAQGIMKTIIVNKLTGAGCSFKIYIADWFAMLNNKMGGDLEKIEEVGRNFIENWKAIGMDVEGGKVEFVWASKEITARADEYLPLLLDIAAKNTIIRLKRCCQIMGRSEQDELSAAQIIYPCMQCADIFFLKPDICQLGMDQRKVNVLAREYCDAIKRKNKPIILSHHMLPGLQQGQQKMSKSDPSSSIFMEDEVAEVIPKIEKAYCPPKIVEGNPCLEYIKYLIMPKLNEFSVERSVENGGNKTFKSFEELIADYESGELHPSDLKLALAESLNSILEPVREHFIKDIDAKDILERVKSFKVTR